MNRFSKYFLFIIIVVSAVLGLMRFNSLQIGASYDDAHYIILAESLASGQGYQLINFPRPQIERAFPPGWPILLTPLTFLFPGNYAVLKLFTLILWLASLILIYKLFSKRIEPPYLEILIGLSAINPLLIGTSVTLMSESAYLFFSLIVLVLFDSWDGKKDRLNYWLIILIALASLYTQLIRTVGISICIALLLYFLLTRRFREAGITVGIFALGTAVQAWLNLRNGGSVISASYESQVFNGSIIEKIGQMWSNTLGYFNEVLAGSLVPVFGEKVTSTIGSAIPLLANINIILLIILGLILSLKKFSLMDVYFLVYICAILAFWNPRVGSVKARFLIPIIPFLYFYLIQGIKWGINKLTNTSMSLRGGFLSFPTKQSPVTRSLLRPQPSAPRSDMTITARMTAGVALVIAALLLARNFQDWRNPVNEQMTDLSIGAVWISQNAPADAIVMVNEPIPAYIHAHRQTVAFPPEGQDLEKYLNNQGVDFIVISPKLQSPRITKLDKLTEAQILPVLDSNPDRFVVVYSNSEYNVTVYRYESGTNQ